MLKHFAIVGSVLILSKLTAFITEIVLAYRLGAGAEADAFNTLFTLHYLLYPLISIGIWKVFLPQYVSLKTVEGTRAADAYANKLITVFFFIALAFSFFLYFGSNAIVSAIVPGFDESRHDMAVVLVQLASPQYVFVIVAAIFSVMLQAHKQFFGSQIREIATYVPLLLVLAFFYQDLGVNSLAIAILVGSICRFLIQLPFINWDYKFRPDFDWINQETRFFLKALPLVMLVCAVDQINQLVTKVYASHLELGAISVLTYATRLNNAFGTLLGVTIGTVLFPRISEVLSDGNQEVIHQYIRNVVLAFCFVLFPLTLFCQVYASDLVSFVFFRGAFSVEAFHKTSTIFALLAFGMLATNLFVVLNNIFYAKKDLKTPLVLATIMLLANFSLCHFLNPYFGLSGLAVANVVAANVGLIALLFVLRDALFEAWRTLLIELFKIGLATFVTLWITMVVVDITTVKDSFTRILIAGTMGAIFYLFLLYVLRFKALYVFKENLLSKMGRKNAKTH